MICSELFDTPLNDGKIFVCGDTHGRNIDTSKLNGRNFPEQKELTKDDVVIQLGDFGWVWYPFGKNKEQEYWIDWLAGKNYTLAVVLGNHENYDIIDALPVEVKWENEVKVLKREQGSIYFLKRGAVYIINGKKILAIGGAESTDKASRVAHESWWEQEKLSKDEMDTCLEEISKHNNVFDYVLTHTCPAKYATRFSNNISKARCSVANFLEYVSNMIEFKEWHFGHFHRDKEILDAKYRCHYNASPFELGEDTTNVKVVNSEIIDATYFDLDVYELYGCGKCVRMEDIKKLPFYALWSESAMGSTMGVSEKYGSMVYLHDWVNFARSYIAHG